MPEEVAIIGRKNLIWCKDGPISGIDKSEFKKTIRLSTIPPYENVFLKYRNVSRKLARNIPSIVMDMLEIGSYIYSADQAISRGGDRWRGNGQYWNRHFVFRIPVREAKIWNKPEILNELSRTLGFLSDDIYEFQFDDLQRDIPQDQYFDFHEDTPWFDAQEVLLFSGGLDSLAGAIDEIFNNNKNVILVTHSPVGRISKRTRELVEGIRKIMPEGKKILHIPVWVNKDKGLAKDNDQRSRSFLYTMLGAAIAKMQGLKRIRFYENGIVSSNLPISEQLVGARASRSTHPIALIGFAKILGVAFNDKFEVDNPFFWKTKSDVVSLIKESGMTDLIGLTCSCSHTRKTTKVMPHCGVCSQCIERRIATRYNNLENADPSSRYEIDLFTGKLRGTKEKTMVESYARHSRTLKDISVENFYQKYGEAFRLFPFLNMSRDQAADSLYELHVRHREQFFQVIENQIKLHAKDIGAGQIPLNSLLGFILGRNIRKQLNDKKISKFPTPEGTSWVEVTMEIVSKDSSRIKVRDIARKFTFAEIGFKDNRKGDLPDLNWETLIDFAQNSGTIDFHSNISESTKRQLKKRVQTINKRLKSIMSISKNPIIYDRRSKAYKFIPTIRDISFTRQHFREISPKKVQVL